MKIGLFLDVDITLTRNIIQSEFARLLGCQNEFEAIETAFQNEKITSREFGERVIALFASKDFTEKIAEAHFNAIKLQTHAEELLQSDDGIDVFFVSNGPNYYVERLAAKYDIPRKRIFCSQYSFNRKTDVLESCKPVSVLDKVDFVKKFLADYDLTIGVGDSERIDGPFISVCTIPILIGKSDNYVSLSGLAALQLLITRLRGTKREVAGARTAGSIGLKSLLYPQLLLRLSLESWLFLCSLIGIVFVAGINFHAFLKIFTK